MRLLVRPLCSLSLLGCVALTLLAAGCDPEPAGLTVRTVTPQPVEQTGLLHIFGDDFGDFVQDESGVLVSGVCAHVALWQDDRIAILVPEGIGTGTRVLQIRRADGRVLTREVRVTGTDRPFEGERPTCRFATGGNPGTDVTPPDDTDDTPTLDGSPDVPPDVILTCPIAIGDGACVGAEDCSTLRSTPEDEFTDLLFQCAAPCVAEPQLALCTSDCLEARLGLSADCGGCFGEAAACAVERCLAPCVADPGSVDCQACRVTNCLPDKLTCTGVLYETFTNKIPPDETFFLQLTSMGGGGNDRTPGAEIDAVQVDHIFGLTEFASDVVRADPDVDVEPGDPNEMLGAPDALFAWPDTSICQQFGAWAMGSRGTAVLRFEEPITSGARIQVVELGDCELVDSPLGEVADAELVQIALGSAPDGPFTVLGVLRGPNDVLIVP